MHTPASVSGGSVDRVTAVRSTERSCVPLSDSTFFEQLCRRIIILVSVQVTFAAVTYQSARISSHLVKRSYIVKSQICPFAERRSGPTRLMATCCLCYSSLVE